MCRECDETVYGPPLNTQLQHAGGAGDLDPRSFYDFFGGFPFCHSSESSLDVGLTDVVELLGLSD
jgi:hypothetical protein